MNGHPLLHRPALGAAAGAGTGPDHGARARRAQNSATNSQNQTPRPAPARNDHKTSRLLHKMTRPVGKMRHRVHKTPPACPNFGSALSYAAHDTKQAGDNTDAAKQSVRSAVHWTVRLDANPLEDEYHANDDGNQPASPEDQTNDALCVHTCAYGLTTQAQRPGPRGRSLATWTRWRCWVIAIGRFAPFNALKARRFCSENRFRRLQHPLENDFAPPVWLKGRRRGR